MNDEIKSEKVEDKQTELNWDKNEEYIVESEFFEMKSDVWNKVWIMKNQGEGMQPYQPKLEPQEFDDTVNGGKKKVMKAIWNALNEEGKLKKFSLTLGGKNSLYAKVKDRLIISNSQGKNVVGLMIKKTGSGILTKYDIDRNDEPMPSEVKK